MVLGNLAQTQVYRLNCIGGVTHRPDLQRILEERGDANSVAAPGLYDRRISNFPIFFEFIQPLFSFFDRSSGVDDAQIECNFFAQLP